MTRERWDRQDWWITAGFFFSILGIPIGLAALTRKVCGQRVYHPEQFEAQEETP